MEVALEELYDLEYELQHEFRIGMELPTVWADGTCVPHPMLQSRVVDFLMEVSQQ
jgi:hypothetical protein